MAASILHLQYPAIDQIYINVHGARSISLCIFWTTFLRYQRPANEEKHMDGIKSQYIPWHLTLPLVPSLGCEWEGRSTYATLQLPHSFSLLHSIAHLIHYSSPMRSARPLFEHTNHCLWLSNREHRKGSEKHNEQRW